MPGEISKISISEKRRILKYAEGANPDVDEPFEIAEETIVHTGEAALALLAQLREEGIINATN